MARARRIGGRRVRALWVAALCTIATACGESPTAEPSTAAPLAEPAAAEARERDPRLLQEETDAHARDVQALQGEIQRLTERLTRRAPRPDGSVVDCLEEHVEMLEKQLAGVGAEHWVAILGRPPTETSYFAVYALLDWHRGSDVALAAVLEALDDGHGVVREDVLDRVVRRYRDPVPLPVLVRQLDAPGRSEDARLLVAEALARMGGDARPALDALRRLQARGDSSETVSAAIARAVEVIEQGAAPR